MPTAPGLPAHPRRRDAGWPRGMHRLATVADVDGMHRVRLAVRETA